MPPVGNVGIDGDHGQRGHAPRWRRATPRASTGASVSARSGRSSGSRTRSGVQAVGLDRRVPRGVVQRLVQRRHLVNPLLGGDAGPAHQRVARTPRPPPSARSRAIVPGGICARSCTRRDLHDPEAWPRSAAANASPGEPSLDLRGARTFRPAAAARSAACRSSAAPIPPRRRAGCTMSWTSARSRFSRSGNSTRYQPATVPSPPGTYQASDGPPLQPDERLSGTPAPTSAARPGRRRGPRPRRPRGTPRTVLSSARSSATISMPSAGPFSAHVRDGDLVEPPARLDHLVAKLLVDRDHVLVGGRVPGRDPLELRLSRRRAAQASRSWRAARAGDRDAP